MTPEIRYVLLSVARSGTTLTTDLINQHPQVYGHPEIFGRKNNGGKIDQAFVDKYGLDGRLTDRVNFVRKVYDFTPGPKCVGFKMWQRQAPDVCDALLQDESVHKIIHEHENYLASYSSSILATMMGISHIPNAKAEKRAVATERPKIPFEKDDFVQVATRRGRQFKRLRKNSKGPTFHSTYQNVVKDGVEPIYAFLGLDPFTPAARLKKVNSYNIIDRFDPKFHDEIRATLDELGHPEWVDEG